MRDVLWIGGKWVPEGANEREWVEGEGVVAAGLYRDVGLE